MHSRDGFVSVEHEVRGQEGAQPTWRVAGADVSAVAFIPRVRPEALPRCGLSELDEALSEALPSWLAEGTKAPPASFDGPRAFLDHLREGRHRGALALVEPTAYLDRDERIVKVTFRLSSGRVGAGFSRRDSGVIFGMGAATDRQRFRVTVADHFARIDCWQRFAMRFAGNLDGRFPDAEVAPLGWLMVTYLLHADGMSQAWCASSYLPSAWFYRDYVRMHRREITQATAVEAESVLRPQPDVSTGTRWACLDTSTGCVNAVA